MLKRLRAGISRTRESIVTGLQRVLKRGAAVEAADLAELETVLLLADVGVAATAQIVDAVARHRHTAEADPATVVRNEMLSILADSAAPLEIPPHGGGPFVILVVGVNGAGKTTTIAKIARRLQSEGKSVMLAAGDTFRAAAVEQLKTWGARLDIPVVAQGAGADSASVIYDAYSSASARGADVLLADTAGRLHTQGHLMAELDKVARVLAKQNALAPHETMLVLDATMGQNAVVQAHTFHEALGVDSIALTKLDGTAKGGVIFSIAKSLGLPIRYIGVGEGLDDLQIFDPRNFVAALLDEARSARSESSP